MFSKIIYVVFFSSLIVQEIVTKKLLGNENSDTKIKWVRQIVLDTESGVTARWISTDDENEIGSQWLTMEIFAPTQGYVGVGFSPHGGMLGSDIVFGWVDSNGTPHLKDMHGVGNKHPVEDLQNDYELLSAKEMKEGTTIRFRRKWDTCDEDGDRQITNETMRLIWAYGDKDPEYKGTKLVFDYHGARRGVKSILLQNEAEIPKFPDDPTINDPDVKYWDLLVENNTVDDSDTTYFCKLVKLPPIEKKHHLIGYRPIVQPENLKNVHHICMYECIVPEEHGGTANVFEKHLSHPGGRCYTSNMPPDWGKYCSAFTFVWTLGSDGEMLPDHVGIPIGEEHNGASYFMLEIHYDNPEKRSFTDSSGARLFYTDKLREHDAGVMLMGYRITPFQMIPPQQENHLTSAICSSECTREGLPSDGIKIIKMLHHAHTAARKLRQRHFRNGVELPMLGEDNFYDFNYQQSHSLSEEVRILPGDELITECDYETLDRDDVVLGGLSTKDEMCQSFMVYYPRVQLNNCGSQIEMYSFFNALGIQNVSGSVLSAMNVPYRPESWSKEAQLLDPPDNAKEIEIAGEGGDVKNIFDLIQITSPNNISHLTVGKYLRQLNWKDQEFGKSVEKNWREGAHYSYCTAHGRRRIPLQNSEIPYTKITKTLKKVDSQCMNLVKSKLKRASSDAHRHSHINSAISVLLSTWFAFVVLKN